MKSIGYTRPLVNLDYLPKNSGDNKHFIKSMLEVTRVEAIKFMDDLDQSMKSNDYLTIAKLAHKIKPVGTYIGAMELYALLGDLEKEAGKVDSTQTNLSITRVRSMIQSILLEIDEHLK